MVRNTVENRLARYERRAYSNAFAALVSIPAMVFIAAIFDGGALGEVARAAIGMLVNN